MKSCVELEDIIKGISTADELHKVVQQLQVISYNNRSDEKILKLVITAIEKCIQVGDKISLINLISLNIIHLHHLKENLGIVSELAEKIHDLSKEINYEDGLALYYSHKWYIEKFKGNTIEAELAIKKSNLKINKPGNHDEFIYHICSYTYAMEQWFEKRELKSALLFHKCFDYFLDRGLYHGLTMSLGALIIIYQQTQNTEKALSIIKKILINNSLLSKVPTKAKSVIHYFIGIGHKLSFNLAEAELHINKANTVLKSMFENSIYAQYYFNSFSRLAEIKALRGDLDGGLEQIHKMERVLENDKVSNRLDNYTRNEIIHTFNLVKFYVQSRLLNFNTDKIQLLKAEILNNVNKRSSNAVLLSEFVLNGELTYEQLLELDKIDNASIDRIKHIINYLIIKSQENLENRDLLESKIKALNNCFTSKQTFVEKALTDLLIAQELYAVKRFAEIYPLLRKYKNQLHKIEVLEMRVFMEAFIQVGAYKNGDPLGPALQYMAIKKCRQYGFSRLENKLLDYLNIQGNDALRMMV
jgi:hypothetical protein